MKLRKNLLPILGLLAYGCAQSPNAPYQGSLADPSRLTIETNLDPAPTSLPSINICDSTRILGKVGDKEITLAMVVQPIMDVYGLAQMQLVAKREYYRQIAREQKLEITPEDEKATRERLMVQIFGSAMPLDKFKGTLEEQKAARHQEMERLLPKVLANQNVTAEDFEFSIFNNAVLWKLAQKDALKEVTDEVLRQAFGIKYGEKVSVRHIQVANAKEAQDVLDRVKKGERFEDIANKESLDIRSRPYGGEVRAFTREDPIWTDNFRSAAFALKDDGEISGPVTTGEVVEVIQRIKRIEPAFTKYEDVRDQIRDELIELVTLNKVDALRERVEDDALKLLVIYDPALAARFNQKVRSGPKAGAMNEVRDEIHRDNNPDAPRDPGSEVAQPPATKPGE